jgi:hypothetical protein
MKPSSFSGWRQTSFKQGLAKAKQANIHKDTSDEERQISSSRGLIGTVGGTKVSQIATLKH